MRLVENFSLYESKPLDDRIVFPSIEKMNEFLSSGRLYPGMLVYCQGKTYRLNSFQTGWEEFGVLTLPKIKHTSKTMTTDSKGLISNVISSGFILSTSLVKVDEDYIVGIPCEATGLLWRTTSGPVVDKELTFTIYYIDLELE